MREEKKEGKKRRGGLCPTFHFCEREDSPEIRLMKALLLSAINDANSTSVDLRMKRVSDGTRELERRKALLWVQGSLTTKRRGELFFTFDEVCAHLSINPSVMRVAIRDLCGEV